MDNDKACEEVWRKQCKALSRTSVIAKSDESENDSDDDKIIEAIRSHDESATVDTSCLMGNDEPAEADELKDLKMFLSESHVPSPSPVIKKIGKINGKPTKAVKTVRRYIGEDSIECIEISYKVRFE